MSLSESVPPSPAGGASTRRSELNRDAQDAGCRSVRAGLSRAKQDAGALARDVAELRAKLRHSSPEKSVRGPSPLRSIAMPEAPFPTLANATVNRERPTPSPPPISALDAAALVGLDENLDRVRMELETEKRHRNARDTEAHSKFQSVKQQLSAAIGDQTRLEDKLEKKINQLFDCLEQQAQHIDSLRSDMALMLAHRDAADEAAGKAVKDGAEALRRETKERITANEALKAEIMDATKERITANEALKSEIMNATKEVVAQERGRMDTLLSTVRQDIQGLRVDIASTRNELHSDRDAAKELRSKLQASEDAATARHRELEGALEREGDQRIAVSAMLDKRCAELVASVDREKLARTAAIEDCNQAKAALAEDMERRLGTQRQMWVQELETSLGRLRSEVNTAADRQASAAAEAHESLRKSVKDEMEQERRTRKEHVETSQGHVTSLLRQQETAFEQLKDQFTTQTASQKKKLERQEKSCKQTETLCADLDKVVKEECKRLSKVHEGEFEKLDEREKAGRAEVKETVRALEEKSTESTRLLEEQMREFTKTYDDKVRVAFKSCEEKLKEVLKTCDDKVKELAQTHDEKVKEVTQAHEHKVEKRVFAMETIVKNLDTAFSSLDGSGKTIREEQREAREELASQIRRLDERFTTSLAKCQETMSMVPQLKEQNERISEIYGRLEQRVVESAGKWEGLDRRMKPIEAKHADMVQLWAPG